MPSRVQLCLALALLLPAHLLVGAQQKQPTISEDEIKRYFEKSSGCDNVDIDSLQYFDFTGKGDEDAVVVASTCNTGTAGPDVHSVVHRERDASLVELKIPDPTDKQQAVLFCRCFYDLSVSDGLLVATYHDQSGRADPLVLKYRLRPGSKEFQVTEVKTAPRYRASFDCDKAKTAVENAICYSSSVAALDVDVDRAYKNWLDHLNNADSDILMKEQREWLHKRDQLCGWDLDIVNCLEIVYKERDLELGNFRHMHPAPPSQ